MICSIGSGMSFASKILTLGTLIKEGNIYVLDPENEYAKLRDGDRVDISEKK